LFNHESERRGETFVSRKITRVVARIASGMESVLYLGNLEAKRDWGHAEEYVEGMWRMLQQPEPDDYVLATGKTHTVREFAEAAFRHIGIELSWRGEGIDEEGVNADTGEVRVRIDSRLYRPTEVDLLLGDPTKAREKLGWEAKVSFEELVDRMMKNDLALVETALGKS
jgi:GDPmannose 4,6-dehydratase